MQPQQLAALVLMAAPALAQAPVYTLTGIAPDDRGGSCVANVGDLDGDGVDDIALGLPLADPAGIESGRLHVHSGKTGALIRTYLGQQAGERLGASVAGIGDVNGDGVPDLIVGAPFYDFNAGTTFSGRAYIFSGQGPILTSFTGQTAGDQLGNSVAGVGDVNGDGVPDYAYGVPFADPNGSSSGKLSVRSGATGSELMSVNGASAGDQLGWSIAGVGDIDGDGRDDVAVGAPGYDNPFTFKNDVGRVYVYGWAPTGLKLIFSSLGSWADGQFGYALDGVGDIDGDTVPDLVVGAPLADAAGLNSGEVRVISGQTQASLFTVAGFAGTQAGRAVANLGDMNGDGKNEIGVGLPWFSFLASNQEGLVWALSGATGLPLHTWNGPQNGALLGYSLASAGDLNSDGYGDVVLGMPFYDTEWTDAGGALVALGAAPYPGIYCTAKVNSAGCTPKIGTNGALSLSIANNFHVTASQILAQTVGILVWSQGPATTPFGGGILCLAPQVERTPGQFSGGSLALPCSGSFDFYFSQAYVATTGLTPGAVVYSQYWSRDNGFAAPNNMSLTNAVWFPVLP